MKPLKIAILHSENSGSYQVRCQTPLLWLKEQGAIEVLPQNKAWEADLVYLQGMQGWPGSLGLVRSFKRNGIRVVADMDADLLEPTKGSEVSEQVHARILEFLGAVDALTAPTERLAGQLSRVNSTVVVTPNGINLDVWRKANRVSVRNRARTVGFAGSPSHSVNLDLLRPALAKLSHEFKVQGIRFVCFGLRPAWLSSTVTGAEVVDVCNASDYPAVLSKLRIDVALAPLADFDFNRNRSALKFYEYAAAGAVTIASNFGPFADAIQDGVSGFLVDNQAESWIRAIWKLLRNDELRLQMLNAARTSTEAHDISKTAPRLLEALEATRPRRDRVLFAFPRTEETEHPGRGVDVVMPIHNEAALAQKTIEAVLPELDASHRLILVADGSEADCAEHLKEHFKDSSAHQWITVHRGTQQQAVKDLVRPGTDIILMASDTQPMPGFIQRMAQTAGSNPAIGTVTAVSNNGSIASVPGLADAKHLAETLPESLVSAPLAGAHLMYVKARAIQKYGWFDPSLSSSAAVMDFSLRLAAEFAHVIDTACWCWRAGSPPPRETVRLSNDEQEIIHKRYPHAPIEIQAYHAADPLLEHRRAMVSATRDPRPRVLQVAHSYIGGGGTEKHSMDLAAAVSGEFLNFGAAPHEALTLYCENVPLGKWSYEKAGWPLTTSDLPANDRGWVDILNQVKPKLIHLQHLLNHPLSLLVKLTGTGIPVVVSLHDYYFLCPDFHLHNCPGVHSCESCFPGRFKGPAQYQALRRDLLGASLRSAAALIAPSQSTAKLMREVYPDLNITVIPHGIRGPARIRRAAEKLRASRVARGEGGKIRFGMIGNLLPVKGIDVILKVWPLVAKGAAELHIYGASDIQYVQRCKDLGIYYHGPYGEMDLPQVLSQIDVGIMPAQVQETFSYTLSEFFAGGIPVIGSDYGALGDRIESGVNGLKVPHDDIQAWVQAINLTISDALLRERMKQGVRLPDSIDQMAAQYAKLYREVMARVISSKELATVV